MVIRGMIRFAVVGIVAAIAINTLFLASAPRAARPSFAKIMARVSAELKTAEAKAEAAERAAREETKKASWQLPAEPSFTDVAPGNWYYEAVEYTVAASLMEGYPDGNFHPERPVDRAEMAATTYRAIGGSAPSSSRPFGELGDVEPGDWFYDAVATIVAVVGIVDVEDIFTVSYDDRGVTGVELAYSPEECATRAHAARLLGLIKSSRQPSAGAITSPMRHTRAGAADAIVDISDLSPDLQATIRELVSDEIMSVTSDGRFAPDGAINRADLAVALYALCAG